MSSQKRRKIAETVTGEESTDFVRLGDVRRRCRSHKNDIFDAFSRLKSERKTCDFVIKFGKEEIHVHRAVLAASSRYYERIFTEDSDETKKGFVEIDRIAPETGKQCIDYIYTGKVQLSCKNPEKLIYVAELTELTSLTDMYLEFLKEKLAAGNCLKFVLFAETCAHRSFAKYFESFTPEEFGSIVSSNDVTSLTQSLLEQFLEAASQCKVDLESLKWNGMVKWVKADETRKSAFSHLFTLINFKNLSEKFIKEEISKEQLVRDSSHCLKIVFDAICTKKSAKTSPTHIILCHRDSRLLLQYDINSKKCSRLSRVPARMFYQSLDLVSCDGDVYIGTGNSLSRFSSNKWTQIMQTGNQCYCRCVVRGRFVYMVTNSSVTEYNIETKTWKRTETKLGFEDRRFSVAASSTHLYAIGGGYDCKSAKEYDFQTKNWEPISSVNHGRLSGAAVFHHGKLYALGGQHERHCCDGFCKREYKNGSYVTTHDVIKVEQFQPTVDTWQVLPNTFQNKNFKAFVIHDKLYTIGGDQSDKINEVL